MKPKFDEARTLNLLRALSARELTFNSWSDQAQVNRATLSRYRIRLLETRLIKYDPIKRMYYLTEKGSAKLQESEKT